MAKLKSKLFELRGKVRDLVFKKTKFGTTVSSYDADVRLNDAVIYSLIRLIVVLRDSCR